MAGRANTIGNTTTLYAPNGSVIERETRSGNMTVIYDAQGRRLGTTTTERR